MDENKGFENEQEKEDITPEQISEETTQEDATEDETAGMEQETGGEIIQPEDEGEEKFSLGREVFEWVQAIVVALVIALALRTFVFTLVNVEGASMEPTLHNGDRLIVTRLGYTPHQGDVIIFRPKYTPKTPYVKRVVATAGQKVDIDFAKGKVYVDGKEMNEPYIKAPTNRQGDTKLPAVVPEGCVFAMGDNRNNSQDSRFSNVGMIKDETIIGHAIWRIWPLNVFGNVQ